MKKIICAAVLALTDAGCTTVERDAAVGGVAGAAIGGLATGRVEGAVIGGVVGAASGVLLGQATRSGYCEYRSRRTGRIYVDRCPAGRY